MYIAISGVPLATTGQHGCYLCYDGGDQWDICIMEMEGAYNTGIKYINCEIQDASITKKPADLTNQLLAIEGLVTSNENPLEICYSNDTNEPATADRHYRFIVEKVKV